MSRIARYPITVPSGVECRFGDGELAVRGAKGELSMPVHRLVRVSREDDQLSFQPADDRDPDAWAHAGTARALANNLVQGVTEGFERRLQLVGVGYRAQLQGSRLSLTVGLSHAVEDATADRDRAARHRQATGRSGGGGDSWDSSAGALQGQRHSLCR